MSLLNEAQQRSLGLHVVTFSGGVIAAFSFIATKTVDLYEAWSHLHVALQELMAASGLILPILSAGFGVYKATTHNKLVDIISAPDAVKAASTIPVTAKTVQLANALKAQP